MSSISLINVTKKYQSRAALENFSLNVNDGETVCLTGPSGCGKSTVLRVIAGLEEIDSGELYIDGKPALDLDVKSRDAVMVSSKNPVYKMSMTVYDNLAYGLKLRKIDTKEIEKRVKAAAGMLGITELLQKKASSLTAGELMRAALCRCAVRRPAIILLDEPLKGLDGTQRAQMMTEIISLKNRLGSAMVIAASDCAAAMTLGDKIAVMKDGRMKQCGSPRDVYENPSDTFTAAFVGTPQINLFEASAHRKGDTVIVRLGLGEVDLTLPASRAKRIFGLDETPRDVYVGVRAEDFHGEQFFLEASPDTVIEARVRLAERTGGENLLYLDIDGKSDFATAKVDARIALEAGDRVRLAVDANKILLFDKTSGISLSAMPRRNLIECKLLADADGNLTARFGSSAVRLPEKTVSRLTDRAVINSDAYLSIAPEMLYTEYREDCETLEGEADFEVRHADYTALYVRLSGISEPKAVRADKNCTTAAGEKITLWYNPEKIDVLNKDFERVTAVRPVTNNTATALVEDKNGTVKATVGKNKFTIGGGTDIKSGSTALRIPPSAVRIAVGGDKNTVKATVLDCDFTGRRTLLYLALDGFEPYFTAAIDGAAKYEIGEKVKIAIDFSKAQTAAVQSLTEYIKEQAKAAPPYVYVEET